MYDIDVHLQCFRVSISSLVGILTVSSEVQVYFSYSTIIFFAPGELIPAAGRSIGPALVMATQPVALCVVIKVLPSVIVNIGMANLYLIYSGICLAFLITVYFILPETLGLSLQEIESLFKEKKVEPLNDK